MTTKKILLVDDTNLFLEMQKGFFERSGCQVLTAKSGNEGLAKIRSEVPDLVLLDLEMPDMNGDEVCGLAKKDERLKKIPIVMLSSRSDQEAIEKCQKAGCDNYLNKPITQKKLLDETARILNIPQRKDVRVSVQIEVEGVLGTNTFCGESVNISRRGMLIKSETLLKNGAVINIKFQLPGQPYHIEAEGVIVRIDEESFEPEFGHGIAFQNLNSIAKKMIGDFIKKKG